MKRLLPAAAVGVLLCVAGYCRGRAVGRHHVEGRRGRAQVHEPGSTPARQEAHPVRADLPPFASDVAAGEFARSGQLQADARLLDTARDLLDARDQPRLALLLAQLDTDRGLGPADIEALALALDCMEELEEGREGAERFLRETHSSRLRKQLRNICLGGGSLLAVPRVGFEQGAQ